MLKPIISTENVIPTMKNKMILGATALMLAATAVLADNQNDSGAHYDKSDLYRANEGSLDLFGTAGLGKYTIDHASGSRVRHNVRFGAGAGLNYFFTRNLGIGGDVYSGDTKGAFIDSASANLIFRLPL